MLLSRALRAGTARAPSFGQHARKEAELDFQQKSASHVGGYAVRHRINVQALGLCVSAAPNC